MGWLSVGAAQPEFSLGNFPATRDLAQRRAASPNLAAVPSVRSGPKVQFTFIHFLPAVLGA